VTSVNQSRRWPEDPTWANRLPLDAIVETDAFLAALRQLPAQQAAAIVLRHHHGYTSREIATSLGIPESTVASRLAHARQRLAVLLHDQDGALRLRPQRRSR
jgi:DNA-directed RNA polymerase specialized sigma24 family protein